MDNGGGRGTSSAEPEEDPLQGLTSEEAAARLQQYGRNEVPDKATPWYALLVRQFVGPFPCMIEVACVLAAVAQKYDDFGIILAMLLINAALGFYQEAKVGFIWVGGFGLGLWALGFAHTVNPRAWVGIATQDA